MVRLTRKTEILLIAIAVVVVLVGGSWAAKNGYIPGVGPTASIVPKKIKVPKGIELAKTMVPEVPLPSSQPTRLDKPLITIDVWKWNAQFGEMLANGGPLTTQGSLMEKHGVNVKLFNQDDAEKMKADLVDFANALKSGDAQPTAGAHFVQIMGDGFAQFAASVNPQLKRLGAEYQVRLIGSTGKSFGEDKFMGPQDWKLHPEHAKGATISGYLRDGDWNIALKWAGDNNIKNNPDEHTYDPDALNWIAADDYMDAVAKLVAGYSEERPVVRDGKKTGEKYKIDCSVQGKCGVVTWTPGDVNAAQQVGGLVPILSTKENDGQMPCAIIGIGKWVTDNRDTTEEMLAAIFEGADQVRLYPNAMKQAGAISAKVYNDQNADYWVKYYNGVTEKDKKGMMVPLGGSAVFNLADNLNLFGLASGHANSFEATYTVFGDIVVQQYPKLVASYPPFKDVVDTSFLENVARKYPATPAEEAPQYNKEEAITQKFGDRNWSINFRSGSAELAPDGVKTVEELARQLVTNHLSVEIHGHTDNAGSDSINMELSRRRADTVKRYLENKFPATFPQGRIRDVIPHGAKDPIADNSSEAGKAKNRRVEIIIGTT